MSLLHPATQLLVGVSAWRAEAMAANWSALSCSAGRQITREYSNMTADFEGPGWSGLDMTSSDTWQVCPTVLVVMGDAWKRTIFNFKVPCVDVSTADDDSMEGARRTAAAVVGRTALCQPCVDSLFSLPWARRLADRAAAGKARRCLRHVLSLLRSCRRSWRRSTCRSPAEGWPSTVGMASRHSDVRVAREAEAPSDASHCDEGGAGRERSGAATVLASAGFFCGASWRTRCPWAPKCQGQACWDISTVYAARPQEEYRRC